MEKLSDHFRTIIFLIECIVRFSFDFKKAACYTDNGVEKLTLL